jgi:3-oxoacyl-[acyl-carrier protein] reductase
MLSGKIALITGASRGIGRAVAELFASSGADVILNALDETSLHTICEEITALHKVKAISMPFDISDIDEVKRGFREIFKITRTLDILVNNAGVLAGSLIGVATPAMIDKTFGVNVSGTIYCCQHAARMMVKQNSGSIINFSSIMGVQGDAGFSVYSGSKAAIIGITKSLAKELAAFNIRVNAIAPGFIDTAMTCSLPADKYRDRINSIKMKRAGTPLEVASAALFLASDMSSYITGQVLGVDGGMVL